MSGPDSDYRRELLGQVPSTDGIPDYLRTTVDLLRAGFPAGIKIDSPDYFAVWSFLDHAEFTHRAIATALGFAFDLNYYQALSAYAVIDDDALRTSEITRVEDLLRPHGLDRWRAEIDG